MAKYVPPNQRNSAFLSDSTISQRWKQDDLQEPGSLQRASRPRADAADITEQMSNVKLDDFPALSKKKVEDFPALPTKKAVNSVVQPQTTGRATYASLASNWVEKAKENEEKEKAKKEAEDAAKRQQEKTDMKVIPVRQGFVAKKRKDSDDEVELDIGCHVSDESEHSDPSEVEYDVEDDEEEEEEEEDPDAFWTQRKHKGDIS